MFTDNDWQRRNSTEWEDPDGWILDTHTFGGSNRYSTSVTQMIQYVVRLGGKEWTRRYGSVPGLTPPKPKTSWLSDMGILPRQHVDYAVAKPKAPTDEQVYAFFATCTAPGCCPKCSAPYPCDYHPGVRPSR